MVYVNFCILVFLCSQFRGLIKTILDKLLVINPQNRWSAKQIFSIEEVVSIVTPLQARNTEYRRSRSKSVDQHKGLRREPRSSSVSNTERRNMVKKCAVNCERQRVHSVGSAVHRDRSALGKGHSAVGVDYTADGKGHSAVGVDYTADGKDYTADGKDYTADCKGHSAYGKDYTADGKDYTAYGKGHSADGKDYTADGKGHSAFEKDGDKLREYCVGLSFDSDTHQRKAISSGFSRPHSDCIASETDRSVVRPKDSDPGITDLSYETDPCKTVKDCNDNVPERQQQQTEGCPTCAHQHQV